MDTTSTPGCRKIARLAILVCVFLLGALAGAGGSATLMLKRLQSNVRNPANSSGVASRFLDRTEKKIADQFELAPNERAAVHEELEITRGKLAEIRVRMVGELRSLSHDTVDRISARLPESKRRVFRERASERLKPWGFFTSP